MSDKLLFQARSAQKSQYEDQYDPGEAPIPSISEQVVCAYTHPSPKTVVKMVVNACPPAALQGASPPQH